MLGSYLIDTLTPTAATPFTTHTYTFTTTSAGSLSFTEQGLPDQQGNLLDNVVLSAAPEPGAWLLMLGGIGLAGMALRRREDFATAQ